MPVFFFLCSVCSAVEMGHGRPLSSFVELHSMIVPTASWWMLLIGVAEWLYGEVLLDVRFKSNDPRSSLFRPVI